MKKQLFFIHFAGGNCYSYDFLRPYLQDFEVVSLELPGRGKRPQENLIRNFSEAVQDLYRQMQRYRPGPNYLIYGHSMGAMLGFRLAALMENMGHAPDHLVVSGNPGPGLRENKQRFVLKKDEFKAELQRLGGIPDNFFSVEELFDFFEPIIRADFEIIEGDSMPTTFGRINVPIFGMAGSEETFAGDMDNWAKYTAAGFRHEIWPGDHFFIHDHPERIVSVFRECLAYSHRETLRISV